MPCNELRLFFGGLDGGVTEFRGARDKSTVADLRARAAELLGIQAPEAELWCGSSRLDDDAVTLEAAHVRDHATVRICKAGSGTAGPARTQLPAPGPRPTGISDHAVKQQKVVPLHSRRLPVDSFASKGLPKDVFVANHNMTVHCKGTTAAVGVNTWNSGTVRWTLRIDVEGPQPRCYGSIDTSHRYHRWGGAVQVGIVPDGQSFVIQDEQKLREPDFLDGAQIAQEDDDLSPRGQRDALEGTGVGWRSDGILLAQLPLANRAGKSGLWRQIRRVEDYSPSHELGVELSLASGRVRFARDSEVVGDCSIGPGTFRLAVRALNAKVTIIDVARPKDFPGKNEVSW